MSERNVLEEVKRELVMACSCIGPHVCSLHITARERMALMAEYIEAAEAQVRVMRGPLLRNYQAARRKLGLEG